MLEPILRDVRYGIRQLATSPGFTLIAAASLALGIGANTAIFQLVDAIRLKTLPVRNPQELAVIDFEKGSSLGGWWSSRSARVTSAQFEEIRRRQRGFTGVIGWSAARFNLTNGGEARFGEGLYVSGNFFELLGVNTVLGRTLTALDDTETCAGAGAVLSYAFWQREFGADAGILGRAVSLDGHPIPVIGVTPPSFFGVEVGNRYDVAIPLCADRLLAEDKKGRIPIPHAFWLSAMGRLRPGWTLTGAINQLHAVSPAITRATLPPIYKAEQTKRYLANKIGATAAGTGVSDLREQAERPLWLLMATTGLVLLIACANLANLLLARASIREKEIAVRLALGASRWRLVRQLLIESLLLAITGTVTGMALAQVLSRGLITFMTTQDNPLFVGLGIDWRVLGFTATLAVITCLLFGLAPAIRATDLAPVSAIRSAGRSLTAGRERVSLRRMLVVTQVALSLVLLVGALLFVRSLQRLMHADAGFKPEGVLTLGIDYGRAQYTKEHRPVVNRQLQERLSAIPGVISAAQVGFTPVSGSGWNNDIGPDGATAAASGKEAFFNRAGPGYFRTMGTTVIAGREFTDRDRTSSPKVAIVNQEFARRFFNGANPVGRTFRLETEAGKSEPLFQIVGLVRNTKYYELREEFRPIGFFPILQDENPGPGANFVLRVVGSPSELTKSIKAVVSGINPSIGLEFRSFSAQLQESIMRERLMATLSSAFGILAGVLSTVGLYGVIAYLVTRRRNEIGVRIALGAGRGRVILLVLREATLLLVVGLIAGLAISLWAGRAASALLFGLKAYDPLSIITAAMLLAGVSLAASYIPAMRAAALEPMTALRDE